MDNNWDDQIQLITKDAKPTAEGVYKKQDVLGDPIYCKVKSVPGSEFYRAGQSGIRPSVILTVHDFEYKGETSLLYRNKKYTIIRTYQISFDELELTCEEKLGGKDGNKSGTNGETNR